MICKNCQKEIDNDSKFCEFCGIKIKSVQQISKPKASDVLFNKRAFHFWIFLISTLLLIIAVLSGSETKGSVLSGDNKDFYTFLRLFIFCVSLYLFLQKRNEKNINSVFPFIIIGIIFNPFIPFRFDNDFLNTIKFFATGFFGYFSYKEYQKLRKVHERN